jgi:ubiquinone/menaquinone biosynthesis C-methylase UbiE
MNKAEFDRFADEYEALHATNIAISGEKPEYFAEYKIRDLAVEYFSLRGAGDAPAVLDFGAGIGASVPFVRKYLPSARLTCLDMSTRSLEVGQARFPGQASFMSFDGIRIPFPDASFDIAFAACVFHHIQPAEHVALLTEFHRVLVPNGIAIVFEHNPYNPMTVHAVNTCPFDENACLIPAATMRKRFSAAGFNRTRIRYRLFFPRMLRALRPLDRWLTWVPLGAQYYAIAVK